MVSDSENRRLLVTWNQAAVRNYVRQVFCFPIDKQLDDFEELCTYIRDRLSLACSRFPHFAGKITVDPNKGESYLLTTADDVVPFKFFDHIQDRESLFGWSYAELRAQGFPCKAFVGPWFDLPYDLKADGGEVPAAEVHAHVIRGGGLLLCIYMHHSITDGRGLTNFVSTFATFTLRDATGAESSVENGAEGCAGNGVENHHRLEHPANVMPIPCKLAWSLVGFLGRLKYWWFGPKAIKAAVNTAAAMTAANNGVENGQLNEIEYPANIDVDIPDEETTALLEASSFDELMNQCPEYIRLPEPTGPTAACTRREWETSLGDVLKTGRIFKFGRARIRSLKALAQNGTKRPVTIFACLAGVTWWFCTVARRAGHGPLEEQATPSTNRRDDDDNKGSQAQEAHLLVPVSWAKRAYQAELAEYAGNAVCLVRVCAGIGDGPPSPSAKASPADGCEGGEATASAGPPDERLAQLICSIDSAIGAVDNRFVATRTALFRAAPDYRFVGLNLDAQDPSDFIFNSWRHFGADTAFWFPGMRPKGTSKPRGRKADAVRRAQPQCNMGAAVVLPGKKDSMYEVLVTLDEASMMRLLANKEWRKWTDQTVE